MAVNKHIISWIDPTERVRSFLLRQWGLKVQ